MPSPFTLVTVVRSPCWFGEPTVTVTPGSGFWPSVT
jgi:hypothetical protein